MRDEIQKLGKGVLQSIGAAEEVAGFIEGGVSVGIRAVVGEPLKGVASVLTGKELMLKKMRDAVGNRRPFGIGFFTEAVVD